MLKHVTRARVIQIWFGAATLIIAASIAFGAALTVGTGALLVALCLVPPAIFVMLWPGGEHPTVAEILHQAEHRR